MAVLYHGFLLFGGFSFAIAYVVMNFHSTYQFLFMLTLPLFYRNFNAVKDYGSSPALDPWLKQLAISTLIFVLFFGLGFALSIYSR
jgi:1,4-dihydroxy-2-naphthoate octaprenyltransferase